MKPKIRPLMLITLFLSLNILFAQKTSLFLSPQLIQLEVPPGATKTFTITIINESEFATARLRVYTSDVTESELGIYKVLDTDTSQWSCAKWITLSEDTFALGPGEEKEIQCRLKVPRDARGGRYAAVVFELLPKPKEKGAAASVVYHFRMPAFVELTIKGPRLKRRIKVVGIEVESASKYPRYAKRFGKDALIVSALVKNEGNIHVFAKGNLKIKNERNRIVKDVPLGAGRGLILPGVTVKYRSVISPLPAGNYIAEVIMNYESPSPAIAKVPFKIAKRKVYVAGGFEATVPLDVSLRPENLEMTVPRGATRTLSFVFTNNEEKKFHVKTEVKDMTLDVDGNIVILDTTGLSWSCKGWISLEPQEFDARPRGRERVKTTIKVPQDAAGEKYAVLVFNIFEKDTAGDKEKLLASLRSMVTLTIPGEFVRKASIDKINVIAVRNTPPQVEIFVKNEGNVHIKPFGKVLLEVYRKPQVKKGIEIIPGQEWETINEVKLEPPKKPLIVGATRKLKVDFLNKLPPGKYRVTAIINYGTKEPAVMTKVFRVK